MPVVKGKGKRKGKGTGKGRGNNKGASGGEEEGDPGETPPPLKPETWLQKCNKLAKACIKEAADARSYSNQLNQLSLSEVLVGNLMKHCTDMEKKYAELSNLCKACDDPDKDEYFSEAMKETEAHTKHHCMRMPRFYKQTLESIKTFRKLRLRFPAALGVAHSYQALRSAYTDNAEMAKSALNTAARQLKRKSEVLVYKQIVLIPR